MLNERYIGYDFIVYDWAVPVFKSLIGVLKEEERIISWNEEVKGQWLVELRLKKDVDDRNKAIQKKVLECLKAGFEGIEVH